MRRGQAEDTGRARRVAPTRPVIRPRPSNRRPGDRSRPAAQAVARAVAVLAVALSLVVGACGRGSSGDGSAATSGRPTTVPAAPVTTPTTGAPTTAAPTTDPGTTAAPAAFDARVVLERLVVDDRPSPELPYRREEWPHWDDVDGNGCDAREDALIAATLEPPELGPACKVLSGEWVSPYDGTVTTDPGAIQIDHLVPLAEAHRSGGWRWIAERRRLFANDQAELVATSGASNQSKGDKGPDQWRPPAREVWCAYALAWARVKVTYDLTVTTSERDALGQMLDTCPADAPADARPGGPLGVPPTTAASAPEPAVAPSPTPAGSAGPSPAPTQGGDSTYYANCAAARAAGAAPIRRGEPGYRSALDRDGDGVACE